MAATSLFLILAAAVQMHCDLPGGNRSHQATVSAEACATACSTDPACQAWSFVGGWNRCFLKQKSAKPVKLQIHAAQIERDAQGVRQLGKIHLNHDSSGKDLRRISTVKDAEACGQLCVEEAQCESIAFLDGYGDCWLKKNKGRLFPKVFYCGLR